MFLVVGLGNPGTEYAETPHNMGFKVVDVLAARHSIRVTRPECRALIGPGTIAGKPAILAKPQTFMNLSGLAVKPLLEKYEIPPERMILVYDELDLPWGSVRVKPNGRVTGHNGAKDVIAKLATQEFPRVRLGVHPGHPLTSGVDYLLSSLSRRQNETLTEFIDLAADATESIIAEGVALSMTRFNRRAQSSTSGETPEE
jgi:PTH1 family peptidyl-tRNA hydrolase